MKAMNLERENFGFLNVFYVEDNPVVGYDNSGFWGISFGPWAYVPPKPKIPDWCKCEKSRRKHREECERRCKESIPDDRRNICNFACNAALGAFGERIAGIAARKLAEMGLGALVGLGRIIGYLDLCSRFCSMNWKWIPNKDEDFWCPFKCWLEERTLCKEPDRWWETGRYPSYPYRFQ